MLDALRFKEMTATLETLPCRVVLPPGWKDFFDRRGPQVWPGDNRRRYVRSHFPMRAMLETLGNLPAVPRGREQHVVLMKDISRGGAGFLHAAPVYPGERVRLWLPHRQPRVHRRPLRATSRAVLRDRRRNRDRRPGLKNQARYRRQHPMSATPTTAMAIEDGSGTAG